MDQQIRKYNSTVRELLDLVQSEFPQNTTIESIQRQFRAAVTTDRTLIIEETAQELLEYRDLIAEGRWDELINTDWENKVELAPAVIVSKTDTDALKALVPMLRELWKSFDETQMKFVQKSLKRLLSSCVKYFKAKADNRL